MADHPRCAELWMDALALRDGTARDPQVKQRALAKLAVPSGILAIAESDSMIRGFALAADRTPPKGVATAHLTLLAVDPTIQARGVGRALLAATTRSLQMAGFVEATLSVLEQNVAARKIYKDAGWQVTGEGVFEDSGRPCVRYLLRLRH
jgi:ribosomal protein S18 acetylase RimI-like enzyme